MTRGFEEETWTKSVTSTHPSKVLASMKSIYLLPHYLEGDILTCLCTEFKFQSEILGRKLFSPTLKFNAEIKKSENDSV